MLHKAMLQVKDRCCLCQKCSDFVLLLHWKPKQVLNEHLSPVDIRFVSWCSGSGSKGTTRSKNPNQTKQWGREKRKIGHAMLDSSCPLSCVCHVFNKPCKYLEGNYNLWTEIRCPEDCLQAEYANYYCSQKKKKAVIFSRNIQLYWKMLYLVIFPCWFSMVLQLLFIHRWRKQICFHQSPRSFTISYQESVSNVILLKVL